MSNSPPPVAAVPKSIPQLSADELAGLRDFFQVYDAHYEPIMLDVSRRLRSDPSMAAALQTVPLEQLMAQLRTSHDLQWQGVRDSDWNPYLSYLQQLGTTYANNGLSFQSFFAWLGAIRPAAMPYLFKGYAQM